jgi:DNA-binding response OmpR family regulator
LDEQLGDRPVLLADTGLLNGRKWTVAREEVIIGRDPTCDIAVPDRQVSRQHARIRRRPDGYWLEDLQSKNGTHLNGAAIHEPTLLQDGDVIMIALALKLTFIGTEATIPLSIEDAARMGLGRLRMDEDSHRVWLGGRELDPPLSPPQFRLLWLLYQNPDRVVGREEVVQTVWPGSLATGVSEQAIDALVRRLRDRLNEVDAAHPYIVTVRGHGFRLENPV